MNKKLLLLLVILTVSVIVGCSKVITQEDSEISASIMQNEVIEDETIPSDIDKNAVDEDASEVIGKVEEIKDFMLVITDDDNVSYAFTFEEKPESLEKIAVGDRVLVAYTGTLSAIDPFMGKFTVTKLSSDGSEHLEENSSDDNQKGDLRSSGITDPYVNPEVKFSNLTSEEDQSELSKDLGKVGIKEFYIKDYINYVNLYNETAPESVLDGWNTLDKVNYDPYDINDVWVQKYPDFVGVCCRMAAFTLLRDDILVNNSDFQKTSMGSLTFDNYSFEMMPTKYMTDENLKAFENFYAPIPTSTSTDKEVQKKVLEQALKERGIQFKNSNLKFIGMVGHNTVDESNPFLVIEHAGVIYEKNGSVYLLEKLAFQEPYQWIKFPSEEEIIKYFESKYNLDTSGTMAEPIYMINDKLF
jgi:hypothetical protein